MKLPKRVLVLVVAFVMVLTVGPLLWPKQQLSIGNTILPPAMR